MSTAPPEPRTPETVVVRMRSHGRALFWPVVLLVVVAGGVGFGWHRLAEAWFDPALLAAGTLLALVGFLLPVLSWLSRNYTITTRRIVLRSGILVRSRQELLHSRGYDVTVRKAGLQAPFRSGDVLINTGLERPVMLRDVPDADLVQSALHDLMESSMNPIAARRQEERNRRSGELGTR